MVHEGGGAGPCEGVAKDHAKAAEWYLKAAELGNADAQYNIGVAYANGEGVKEDVVTAYMWWIVCSMTDPSNEDIAGALKGLGKDLRGAQIKEAERMAKAKFEEIKQRLAR